MSGMQRTLLRLLLLQKNFRGFFLGVVASFGFSISVILCTIGIMDGFESTLKNGLHKSSGDAIAIAQRGFFKLNSNLVQALNEIEGVQWTPILQTEGFAVIGDSAVGSLVRGVQPEQFGKIADLKGLDIPTKDHICIGSELAKKYNINKGDKLAMAFARGNEENASLPGVFRLEVSCIIHHGVYLKDLRLMYTQEELLHQFITIGKKYNILGLDLTEMNPQMKLEDKVFFLNQKLEGIGEVRPYWSEYEGLLEAVEIEKVSIGVILQIIVVVALFNLVAFFMFLADRKSKELFLIQALGLGKKELSRFWMYSNFLIWSLSCLLAIVLTEIFNLLLQKAPFLQVPGEIYVLSRLQLVLSFSDYAIVFLGALAWNFLFFLIFTLRQRNKSLIELLRGRFT